MNQYTEEQVSIIKYAKNMVVRAVPGSGKTQAALGKIVYAVRQQHINPKSIVVLMFNDDARQAFIERLSKYDIECEVHTFHSFAHRVNAMILSDMNVAEQELWEDYSVEVSRVMHSIGERAGLDLYREMTVQDVITSIGAWKHKMILPEDAYHPDSAFAADVYREFEDMRKQQESVTYDDFVPRAVSLLAGSPHDSEFPGNGVRSAKRAREWLSHVQMLIVDEVQDMNFAQYQLVKIIMSIAGPQLVALGDEWQTIYRWRGSDPNFAVRDMPRDFGADVFHLSRTFRLPMGIAASASLISKQNVRAHDENKLMNVTVLQDLDANSQIADYVTDMVASGAMKASDIVVLCRAWAQLNGLATTFLRRRVPFQIERGQKLFATREIGILTAYVRVAQNWNGSINSNIAEDVVQIINVPNRKVRRTTVQRILAQNRGQNLHMALASMMKPHQNDGLYEEARQRIGDFVQLMEKLSKLVSDPGASAFRVLSNIRDDTQMEAHWEDVLKPGDARTRNRTINSFIEYASECSLTMDDGQSRLVNIREFMEHLEEVDTTQGLDEQFVIRMTTAYRMKGDECKVVILPEMNEGLWPMGGIDYDTALTKRSMGTAVPRDTIKEERNLWYVAITRAKHGVIVTCNADGASPSPSRFLYQSRLDDCEAISNAIVFYRRGDINALALIEALEEHAGGQLGPIFLEYLEGDDNYQHFADAIQRAEDPDQARLLNSQKEGSRAAQAWNRAFMGGN